MTSAERIILIFRLLTMVQGAALIGRLVRDRFEWHLHFASKPARSRWLMMLMFASCITLSMIIATAADAPVTAASWITIGYCGAFAVAHFYLDALRPRDLDETQIEAGLALARIDELIEEAA